MKHGTNQFTKAAETQRWLLFISDPICQVLYGEQTEQKSIDSVYKEGLDIFLSNLKHLLSLLLTVV